ncbi:GAF domain-containing protein [Candidatus Fermentibacteria bacterium]|nr:GAF domain-containing protein [Candidatus Fermentibacteria bacterium]
MSGASSADSALFEAGTMYQSLHRLMRLMCDNVPDLIWAKDAQKRYLFANKAMCERLLNATHIDEPRGKTDMFFAQRERAAHPDRPDWHTFGEICRDSDEEVMRSGKPGRFDEYGNVRGEPLYLDVYKAPLVDEKGRLLGTVGCGRVVTRERHLEAEQKSTEEALRESQQMLRLVLDTIPVRVFWKDTSLNYLGCNRPFAQDGGLATPQEIIGKNDYELGWSEQADLYRADDRSVITRGLPKLNYEEPQTTPDGGRIWLCTSKIPLRDSSGGVRGVLGTYEDVTERKRQEIVERVVYRIATAVHSVDDLDQLFEAIRMNLGELMPVSNMYVALFDTESNTLSFPYFLDQAMDAPVAKPLGKGLTEYVLRTGEPLLATPEVFDDLVARGEVESLGAPSIDWLGVPLRAGDSVVGVLAVQTYDPTVRYTDSDRQMLAFVSDEVATAIARKRHEEEQAAQMARIRSQQAAVVRLATSELVASGDFAEAAREFAEVAAHTLQVERVGIWLGNPDEQMRCVDLYALSDQTHASGLTLEASKHPRYFAALLSDRAIAADEALTDPRTSEFRESYLIPHGITSMLDAPIRVAGRVRGIVCFEHVGKPRRWRADEERFAGEIADQVAQALVYQQRRRAEEERRALEKRVQHTQKLESLGVLAGGIAHDFNNILTAILGHADLALLRLPPVSPARHDLERVVTAARRAADISRQLLAYSGKGQFVSQRLDLKQVVVEMAHILNVSISKKASLRFSFATELSAIHADPGQIRQVIMNLIINASESLGEGEGEIILSTGVRYCDRESLMSSWPGEDLPEGHYVCVEVADTGCGMDEATMARLFDPFFTTKFAGRGLGLAAVLGIIRGHGGAIQVESTPGQGSLFRVLFPPASEAVVCEGQDQSEAGTVRGVGTVLLVDDEESVRSVGKEMLELLGYAVLIASDGQEAVAAVREKGAEISCVILDLTMPRMDGVETFGELRSIREDLPVILSSGYAEHEATRHFTGSGLTGFIQKPYLVTTLGERIREALSGGRKG